MTNHTNSDAKAIQQMLIETVLGKEMGVDVALAQKLLAENNDIFFETDLGFSAKDIIDYQQKTIKVFGLARSMAPRTLNQTTNHVLDTQMRLAAA